MKSKDIVLQRDKHATAQRDYTDGGVEWRVYLDGEIRPIATGKTEAQAWKRAADQLLRRESWLG